MQVVTVCLVVTSEDRETRTRRKGQKESLRPFQGNLKILVQSIEHHDHDVGRQFEMKSVLMLEMIPVAMPS